ncbi:hypothetical protein D9M71_368130 [compost metagenome]
MLLGLLHIAQGKKLGTAAQGGKALAQQCSHLEHARNLRVYGGSPSEPLVAHAQAGIVAGLEQCQLIMAARHFPGQEITRGLQFALVEVVVGRVAQGQPLFGMDRLLQPAPADHAMPKGFEVQRRVSQGKIDLTLGQVAEQP